MESSGVARSSSSNSDFQSELLRMNGSLQSSITELRYHCEVYRLSLRSICKVLASVQKEQDARLRYLATSRPSFHAYLLNLSQRQALDRIRNVARKASTFINGYSLVDKQLFQPPPPKPSTARRIGGDENKKTAPATNSTNLTEGLGWISKSCSSGGGNSSSSGAIGILPVIAEEDEEETNVNTEVNDGAGTASPKNNNNNNGKVERKHRSSSRLRRGGEAKKKKASLISSKKSKSRSTRSRSSHNYSSSASGGDVENKKHRRSSSSNGSNFDCNNKSSRKEIKRRSEKERTSRWNSSGGKICFDTASDRSNSTNIIQRDADWKKPVKQIRSKSITSTHDHQDNNHRRHHHHRRHQVTNSRTLASQHDEEQLDEDERNTGVHFSAAAELNKCRKQQSPLMSQSNSIANHISPPFNIATSSAISSAVMMRRNKTSGTSHISERLRMEARRGVGIYMRRPSKEKQHDRRASNINRKDSPINNECGEENRNRIQSSRNMSAFRLKEILESKTQRTGTTTRRWGVGGTSTLTAAKAGYKVRESLAVVRNRNNNGGGGTTSRQGQGGVAAATRKYLFSSYRSRNNFKLNSATSSEFVPEKVRRIQLHGRRNGFCGGINEDKMYGAMRKNASNNSSSVDIGNGCFLGGGGNGIRHNTSS